MLRFRPVQLASIAAATATISAALIALGPPSGSQELPDQRAESFLRRMAGTEGAPYHCRRLVVYMGEPQSAAVLDVRSGAGGTFVRSEAGPSVTRVWRNDSRGLVSDESNALEDAAPPAVGLSVPAVLRKYAVHVGERSTLLGVPAVPLELERRRDRALVERLWVQPDTGVVYRRELYGASGDLVGLATTLDMWWGDTSRADPMERDDQPVHVDVRPRGDAPARLPYDYRFVAGYRLAMDGRPADHWVYSDGMHALSVFRTAGGLREPDGYRPLRVDGGTIYAGPGPGTWAWEGRGASWVVVAEESALDPAELMRGFPRGGPSVLSRLGSVWARGWHAVRNAF